MNKERVFALVVLLIGAVAALVAQQLRLGGGVRVSGAVTLGAIMGQVGTGGGFTQWTSGPQTVSASGTVKCGAGPANQFVCSDNGGPMTQMAMIAGDIGGVQGVEQVNALHLTSEGWIGNQALTASLPNDGGAGTTQFRLAKIGATGVAVSCGTADTGVQCYPVVSATSALGNARIAIGGTATLKANATGYTAGDFIGEDPAAAGTGIDLGNSVSGLSAGTCVVGTALTSAAAAANGTVLVSPFCVR